MREKIRKSYLLPLNDSPLLISDRHTPLISIVKSLAKSLATPSSTAIFAPRNAVETGEVESLDIESALPEAGKGCYSSRRSGSVGGVKCHVKEDDSKVVSASATEERPFATSEESSGASAKKNDPYDGDGTRCVEQNELSISRGFSLPLRKFPRNVSDTISSSVYEQTIASVDSAYYSLTVGKSAVIAAAAGDVETAVSGKAGRGISPSGTQQRLDNFFERHESSHVGGAGVPRGDFNNAGVEAGAKNGAIPKISKYRPQPENRSGELVASVAIDMERPAALGTIDSSAGEVSVQNVRK